MRIAVKERIQKSEQDKQKQVSGISPETKPDIRNYSIKKKEQKKKKERNYSKLQKPRSPEADESAE